jgi:hypothetical protein
MSAGALDNQTEIAGTAQLRRSAGGEKKNRQEKDKVTHE